MISEQRISFGGRSIAIQHPPHLASLLDTLFGQIAAYDATPPHQTFTLTQTDAAYHLHRAGEVVYEGPLKAELAGHLLAEVGYHLADKSDSGLFFHAAGVAYQSRGILLPGASGNGKTTLTAWLLSQGFDYLSDEFIFVPLNTAVGHFFPRPLNLKRPARQVLQPYLDYTSPHILSHREADIVPPALLGTTYGQPTIPLRLIIFPHYQAKASLAFASLSAAQAAMRLLQTLINSRNLPAHGFNHISQLAQQIPSYTLRYSNFAQLNEWTQQMQTLTS